MDFFQHRYYRLCKILMMMIGQWPYQSTRVRLGILAVLLIFNASAIIPEILGVLKYRDDANMLLDIFILTIFGIVSFLKLLSFIVHAQKRLKLLNFIHTDWQLWARDREVNILHDFAEQGEKITVLYIDLSMLRTVVAYLSFIVVMVQPLMPTIIEILLRNDTAYKNFPYPVVFYNIDDQKYFFYLVTYAIVGVCFILTIIVSNDIILIIYVQHACGIFAALGHKLKRIGNNATSVKTGENPHLLRKKYMIQLAWCINRHNDAIEYTNLIEASYTRTFFMSIGLGMLLINLVGLQVVMATNDLTTSIRYIFFVLGIMFYFYMECYVSQILIDQSISLRFYIYDCQWYKLPTTAQKILQFMIMRCTVPCELTAGKMLVLSVRTFMAAFKTTVSYFGFLRSTQGI